jgi:hypothetical protein
MWGGFVPRVVLTLRIKETLEEDNNGYVVFK